MNNSAAVFAGRVRKYEPAERRHRALPQRRGEL